MNRRRDSWRSLQFVISAIAIAASGGAYALPGADYYKSKVPTENCFFVPSVSSDWLYNNVYPDSNAVYQCSFFSMPEGSQLTIRGEYPRARSLSWTIYGNKSDQINDTDIRPDSGSTNPFINGNDRHTKRRSYTVQVMQGHRPTDSANIPPNTIYQGGATQDPFGGYLCGRIYVPDKDSYPFGGTRLPDISLRLSDGTVLQGAPMCEKLNAQNHGFGPTSSDFGFVGLQNYVALRQGRPGIDPPRPPTWPAESTPVFRAFFNSTYQTCIFFTPEQGCGPDPVLDPAGVGLGNPSNRYVETWIDRGFGEVVVLRAKKPTTPKTWHGPKFVKPKDYDLRYFSICPQESLNSWRVGDCIFDEEIPTDSKGFYTVVLSKPSYRPKNARQKCGFAWAALPEAGDGAGDINLSDMWIRNQLPSPNFKEAAQNVKIAGTEQEVMGDYYPRGQYMSKDDFEKNYGCPGGGKP